MSEAPPAPAVQPPSRLKRWLPTLLGLGFAACGLAAIGFAQSGLEVQVRPPQAPGQGPDPIALLRDDVATVQNDLGALSKGIGTNLEALGTALDTAAEERHSEQAASVKTLDGRVARLESSLSALSQEERRLRGEVAALRSALQSSGAGAPATVPAEPVEPEPVAAATPEPAAPVEPAPVEPAPKKKRRKRGLFSFKMAGGGPDFNERQRYTVIPSLSRVGFDAKSTLHDFSGVTSKVEGSFVGKLGSSDPDASGRIRAVVADLRTGVDGRDEEMRKVLAAEKHPHVQFDLTSLEVSESDAKARTSVAKGLGSFTIHGVSREVAVPLKISVDASKRLVLTGEATLDLTQFQVEVPDMGAIGMESKVKVWLSLRLRSLGKAGK